jgi:hypothetical protein
MDSKEKNFQRFLNYFEEKKSENIYDDLYKEYELTDEFYLEDNLVNDGKTMYNVMKMFVRDNRYKILSTKVSNILSDIPNILKQNKYKKFSEEIKKNKLFFERFDIIKNIINYGDYPKSWKFDIISLYRIIITTVNIKIFEDFIFQLKYKEEDLKKYREQFKIKKIYSFVSFKREFKKSSNNPKSFLESIGFKPGHASRFVRKYKKYFLLKN